MSNEMNDTELGELSEMDEKKPWMNSVVFGGILLTFVLLLGTFLFPAVKYFFK